jgi:tetratricopeptide (TPR) repeat protein
MPTEIRVDPRKGFVPSCLPWLLATAAFVVYCLTLQHWVSLYNVDTVAKVSGWDWRPQLWAPLTFLVTLPFRCLPVATIPLALNLFTAVCASLTLALLARSVALLPQDRTDAQRKREKSDFGFLTIPAAWLPPVLAVTVCGLQLTFWEHATNFSGEMFDLLLFAFVIWLLLEYRLDEKEGRLFLAAFIYGAGMAENWAMVGFFPLFLTAIIWIRGLTILDSRFVFRMLLCGIGGLLIYLLLPLLAISGKVPVTFWEALKVNLTPAHAVLKSMADCVLDPTQYLQYVSMVLAYLLPILVITIRWKASFGDSSQIGAGIANFILHIAHAAFLAIFIWMAFDPPQFGLRNLGGGLPLLTFFYLGALAIGYLIGYFLLLLSGEIIIKRPRRPPPWQMLRMPVLICVWLVAAVTILGLIYHNAPLIGISNDDTLYQYAKLAEQELPRTGGYLLSDSGGEQRLQLLLLQSILAHDGRGSEYVPLDTGSLTVPAYHHYLHEHFPKKFPDLVSATKITMINPLGLIQLLGMLSQTNDLFYLEPSFGYYFEEFYLEPHGLVYKLKPLPKDTLLAPKPDENLVSENEEFWTREAAPTLSRAASTIASSDSMAPLSLGEQILYRLHISRQPNQNAVLKIGDCYSRSLDYWGVQLQRAGKLDLATTNFEAAIQFNPDNVVAQINLAFNKKLKAGNPVTIDLSQASMDQFGKYATWNDLLNDNGPFDDPNYRVAYGAILFRGNDYFRQSIDQFERVHELAPDYLPAYMVLAQCYLANRLPQRARELLSEPIENPKRFSLNAADEISVNTLMVAAYFQENDPAYGVKLIDSEIARHPDNLSLLTTSAQIFVIRGLFTNALAVVDRGLKLAPNDPQWLYLKGYSSIQVKAYPTAISALNRVLTIQTNNYDALFNRALAYLDSDQLNAAHADYARLQETFSNAVPIAYGLGEIAWREHNTNDAIRNYQLYLANANTNMAEAKTVAARLKSLKQ